MITFEQLYDASEVEGRLRPLFERLNPAHFRHVYHVRIDGETRALAAIFLLHEGVGECMVETRVYGVSPVKVAMMVRALSKMLRKTMTDIGLRRVQCNVDIENTDGIRLVTVLGFTCEGLRKKYGPGGKDHAEFAIYA